MSKLSKAELKLMLAKEAIKAGAIEHNAVRRENAQMEKYIEDAAEKKRRGAIIKADGARQRHILLYEKLKYENPTKDESWIRKQVAAENKVDRRTVERALNKK
jgi:uncharacterized protein YllA (UPF0747 family)